MQKESQSRATAKYKKSHIKRVALEMQKEYFENVLKPAAETAGETVNGYIKKAIARRIEDERHFI